MNIATIVVRTFTTAAIVGASLVAVRPADACDVKGGPVSRLGRPLGVGANMLATPLALGAAQRGGGPGPEPNPPGHDASIVGLWLGDVTIGGQGLKGYEAFTSDGLEILYDSAPPSTGNVCLGVWAAFPGHVIRVTHPAWNYLPDGTFVGTLVISERITIDPDGNHFHGTVTLDVYDLNAVKLDHQEGTITARRITVQ